jgi:hypothetical protein
MARNQILLSYKQQVKFCFCIFKSLYLNGETKRQKILIWIVSRILRIYFDCCCGSHLFEIYEDKYTYISMHADVKQNRCNQAVWDEMKLTYKLDPDIMSYVILQNLKHMYARNKYKNI